MKYNKSEIMKKAWSMFRMARMFKKPETFADFLKIA